VKPKLTPETASILKRGRDQIAADLRQIESGALPGITDREIAFLRAKLRDMERLITEHEKTLH
jgi:hypothetical protein